MDNTAISIKLINGKWCLLRYPPPQYIRNSHKLIRGEPKILKRFTTQEAAAAAADEIRKRTGNLSSKTNHQTRTPKLPPRKIKD